MKTKANLRAQGRGLTQPLAAIALALGLAGGAYSADWNLDNNGDWNSDANWTNPDTFPNTSGAVADFSKLNITVPVSVTLGTNITVGSIILGDTDGSHPYTFVAQNGGETLTMDVASGNATIINNSGPLSNIGANTFNLNIALNDNLVITNNALTANVTFNSPIDGTGRTVTIQGIAPAGNYNANLVRLGAANTFSKLVIETGGIADVTLNSGSGSTPDEALGAVPGSFTADALTLDGGILRRAGGGTLTIAANRGITLTANGGTLNASNANRKITVDSVITGAGSLTTHGLFGTGTSIGTVTLNKANTYGGNTIVASGTLALAADGTFADSPTISVAAAATLDLTSKTSSGFTFGSGQTLGGSGSVALPASGSGVSLAGFLAPGGGSAGTLTFTNAGTFDITSAITSGTGRLQFGLGTTGTSDLVTVAGGTLAIGGGLLNFDDFAFTELAGFGQGTYTLFSAQSLSGTLGATTSGSIGSLTGTLQKAGNTVQLVVVPEPACIALAGIGVALAAWARRLRRRDKPLSVAAAAGRD